MDSKQISTLKLAFDEIVHMTDEGVEYWYAREIQSALGYLKWDKFQNVIEKAKSACKSSGNSVQDHFLQTGKMVSIGSGAERKIEDIMLTRYACYLVAMNGDSSKSEIAFAQTYFALQTRKQELLEQRLADMNRLQLREQLKTSEKRLSQNIYERGVDDKGFGRIRSKGDQALFGGNTTEDMNRKYGITSGPLADYLPPVTVAAKNLATEMTNLNIEDKDLRGEDTITAEHVQNNESVRGMLKQRGITPEKLKPAEDIKKVARRFKSEEKKLASKAGKLPATEKK